MGALTGLLERARGLDLHYIPSRYPNGLPSGYPHRFYGRETAEQALNAAESILVFIRDYYQAHGEADILGPEET